MAATVTVMKFRFQETKVKLHWSRKLKTPNLTKLLERNQEKLVKSKNLFLTLLLYLKKKLLLLRS